MTVPTAEQLTKLRQRPHRTKLSLAVYQPGTILAAQINMPSISRGEREITIDVFSGDVWSIVRGMTCYIGSVPGGQDRRIRAISCTATTLTVAENDYNWLDGQYLTIANFFEPWAVFPRIVLDDNNVPYFYKDYDISYTNQNEQFDPVVALGPCVAKFLDETPSGSFARVFYSSSGTYDPSDNSIPTGHAWFFEGGYPTATFGPEPGYIEYTGGGHFTTTHRVTTGFGKTFDGKRHVMILNEVGQGAYPPISHWGFSSMDGARDNGGYSIRLWVREEADYTKIADGALCVIYSDDSEGVYDNEKVGGNAENRSETFFVGYVENDSISINAITNRLEFRAESVTGLLKRMATFSATLEDVQDAATWNEMTVLTVDKALIHYLRWHTTLMTIADYSPMGDFKPVQFIDFERGNIYDAVNNIAASTLVGTVCADRQGKVWAEIDANVRPTGSARSLNTVMELTRQDWRSNLDIQVVHDDVLSYLEMGGIAYSGAITGSTDPYLGGAPGDAPSYYGGLERVSGLVLEGQVPLNELVGLAWARANADYPEVTIPMAGDYRVFDIAPQERVLVTLEPEDTYRGFTWDLKPFIPQSVRYTYEAGRQSLSMEMAVREETHGPPGESVVIPVEPPFPIFIAPEINLPPLELPPPIPPIPIDPAPGTGDLAYAISTNKKFTRTRNLLADTPTWEDLPVPSNVTGSFFSFLLDPGDPVNGGYMMTNIGSAPYGYWLYKITNMDSPAPVWTEIMSAYDMAILHEGSSPPTAFQLTMYDFDISPMNPSLIYIQGSTQALASSAYIARSYDTGATWARKTIVAGRLQDSWNRVSASEHSLFLAYTVPGWSGGAHQHHFEWTTDTVNWNLLWRNQVNQYHVPYQGNAADLGLYESRGDGTSKRLYYSEDRGVTSINITPSYLGSYHAVQRGAVGASVAGARYKDNVTTHPSNRLFVAALLQPAVAEPNDAITRYFTSSSGPEGLEVRFDFNYGNSRGVTSLRWHRTNVNVLTACGQPTSVQTVPGRILVTEDGGVSWADKFDSWYSQVMGGVGTKPTFKVVELVWTV